VNLWAISLLGAARAGVYIAERRFWLPGRFYYQKALAALKRGDIKAAARYNAVALSKKPQDESVAVLKELILMQRDARRRVTMERVERERLVLNRLRREHNRVTRRLQRRDRLHRVQRRTSLPLSMGISILAGWAAAGAAASAPLLTGTAAAVLVLGILLTVTSRTGRISASAEAKTLELKVRRAAQLKEMKIRRDRIRALRIDLLELDEKIPGLSGGGP
jgi:hypothetical protein